MIPALALAVASLSGIYLALYFAVQAIMAHYARRLVLSSAYLLGVVCVIAAVTFAAYQVAA